MLPRPVKYQSTRDICRRRATRRDEEETKHKVKNTIACTSNKDVRRNIQGPRISREYPGTRRKTKTADGCSMEGSAVGVHPKYYSHR